MSPAGLYPGWVKVRWKWWVRNTWKSTPGEFSFERAWKLSGRKWRGAYRSEEALGLSTFEQCQTLHLRGLELQERVKRISGGYRASEGKLSTEKAVAMRTLREWTERLPRMKPHRHVYEALWLARELLGSRNATNIPRLLSLMLGDNARDRKTIRDKLATLDRLLGR